MTEQSIERRQQATLRRLQQQRREARLREQRQRMRDPYGLGAAALRSVRTGH